MCTTGVEWHRTEGRPAFKSRTARGFLFCLTEAWSREWCGGWARGVRGFVRPGPGEPRPKRFADAGSGVFLRRLSNAGDVAADRFLALVFEGSVRPGV